MVETEQSTEPCPTANRAFGPMYLFTGREQHEIPFALMISFVVKMREVVLQREAK